MAIWSIYHYESNRVTKHTFERMLCNAHHDVLASRKRQWNHSLYYYKILKYVPIFHVIVYVQHAMAPVTLTHSHLKSPPESIVCYSHTFENNLRIKQKSTKYLKESCCLASD